MKRRISNREDSLVGHIPAKMQKWVTKSGTGSSEIGIDHAQSTE